MQSEKALPVTDGSEPKLLQKSTDCLLHWGVEIHGTGSAGPTFFNLGLLDTVVILLVVDIVYVRSAATRIIQSNTPHIA
ncbi:hypothetical protein C0991_001562 [Blastosporella zonata]|nr:hypothetical protein C0991_001562 [Blastosporella zonata]